MLLVSFDVVSMYPNITLDHGIRVVRRKLLDRGSKNASVECIIDAIKVSRTCSNIQLHQQAVVRSIPRTVANRVRRNTDNKFVRATSEYSKYLLRAGYSISTIILGVATPL